MAVHDFVCVCVCVFLRLDLNMLFDYCVHNFITIMRNAVLRCYDQETSEKKVANVEHM